MYLPVVFGLLFLQAPEAPKLATLEGTVLHAGSKAAIRKAKVSLVPIGSEENTSVETGDDGKFLIKDVKPGRYRINASKTGYDTTAFGAKMPGDQTGQILRIDPGSTLKTLDITLPKHGVVFGKILDSDSEPVPKALVLALTNMYYQNGKRTRIPRGSVPVISNDLGEYRIGELPPGHYIICAIPQGFYQPTPGAAPSKPGTEDASLTTCYPNSQQMGDATQVEIKDASEIPGIDIRLNKGKTVTVHGRITGVPAGAGMITILNLNTKGMGPIGNAFNPRAFVQSAEGKFEFKNVAPGSYILHTLPTGLGNMPFVVKMNVEVGNQPITELQAPALVPFEVKGKIKADPDPDLKLGSVRVILQPADEITSSVAMANATADGDLTIANIVPGRYRATITGVPPTHYIKELRAGEQISDGDEIDIGDSSAQVLVTLATSKSGISGAVTNDKGEAMPAATIGIIPEPRRAFRQRLTRSDQGGAFQLNNVPPGDYWIVALDRLENGALDDDEYLKPIKSKFKKVKVEEGTSQSITLPVLAAPQR